MPKPNREIRREVDCLQIAHDFLSKQGLATVCSLTKAGVNNVTNTTSLVNGTHNLEYYWVSKDGSIRKATDEERKTKAGNNSLKLKMPVLPLGSLQKSKTGVLIYVASFSPASFNIDLNKYDLNIQNAFIKAFTQYHQFDILSSTYATACVKRIDQKQSHSEPAESSHTAEKDFMLAILYFLMSEIVTKDGDNLSDPQFYHALSNTQIKSLIEKWTERDNRKAVLNNNDLAHIRELASSIKLGTYRLPNPHDFQNMIKLKSEWISYDTTKHTVDIKDPLSVSNYLVSKLCPEELTQTQHRRSVSNIIWRFFGWDQATASTEIQTTEDPDSRPESTSSLATSDDSFTSPGGTPRFETPRALRKPKTPRFNPGALKPGDLPGYNGLPGFGSDRHSSPDKPHSPYRERFLSVTAERPNPNSSDKPQPAPRKFTPTGPSTPTNSFRARAVTVQLPSGSRPARPAPSASNTPPTTLEHQWLNETPGSGQRPPSSRRQRSGSTASQLPPISQGPDGFFRPSKQFGRIAPPVANDRSTTVASSSNPTNKL